MGASGLEYDHFSDCYTRVLCSKIFSTNHYNIPQCHLPTVHDIKMWPGRQAIPSTARTLTFPLTLMSHTLL